MNERLTDTSPEGVAEIKRVFEHCGEDTCRGFVEALIDALERERARVAKLEAALRFLFEETKWNSVDKDNMEFDGRVTCYQLDRARAALKDAPQ